MIPESDLEKIREWAQRHSIHSIYLFGSSLQDSDEAEDIDLGIEGIPRKRFFELTGELEWALSKTVDVVDLDSNNPFAPVVRKYGRLIYG